MAGRPPKTPAPPFGEKLAELRNGLELTQVQMAEKLGITVDKLIYYERKSTNPSIEFVCHVAKTFNISTDYLLGLISSPKKISSAGKQ